jgi:hypothetical protein
MPQGKSVKFGDFHFFIFTFFEGFYVYFGWGGGSRGRFLLFGGGFLFFFGTKKSCTVVRYDSCTIRKYWSYFRKLYTYLG